MDIEQRSLIDTEHIVATAYTAGWSAAKREQHVLATGVPAYYSATLTMTELGAGEVGIDATVYVAFTSSINYNIGINESN